MSDPVPRSEDLIPYAGALWRLVEAQHRISTNRLAASSDDQALLEELVEEVKPTLPPAARGLHYLLATPFRYGHRKESRFRKAGERPGIFYASEHLSTAVAETAYWRMHFFSRSPGFTPPTSVVEHSAFSVSVDAPRSLDLTAAPFASRADLWTDPDDYTACQRLAAEARTVAAQAIRYRSVRDPEGKANVALLDPAAFAGRAPKIGETWLLRYEGGQMTAFAAFPSDTRFNFTFAQFGLSDPHPLAR